MSWVDLLDRNYKHIYIEGTNQMKAANVNDDIGFPPGHRSIPSIATVSSERGNFVDDSQSDDPRQPNGRFISAPEGRNPMQDAGNVGKKLLL